MFNMLLFIYQKQVYKYFLVMAIYIYIYMVGCVSHYNRDRVNISEDCMYVLECIIIEESVDRVTLVSIHCGIQTQPPLRWLTF